MYLVRSTIHSGYSRQVGISSFQTVENTKEFTIKLLKEFIKVSGNF
jgi:hypothetical protein